LNRDRAGFGSYTSILRIFDTGNCACDCALEGATLYIANLMTSRRNDRLCASRNSSMHSAPRRGSRQSILWWANRKSVSADVARLLLEEGAVRCDVDLPILQKHGVTRVLDSLRKKRGHPHDSSGSAMLLRNSSNAL